MAQYFMFRRYYLKVLKISQQFLFESLYFSLRKYDFDSRVALCESYLSNILFQKYYKNFWRFFGNQYYSNTGNTS